VAKNAILTFVPIGNDVPHQAVIGISFYLLQTFLAAVLTLGPT